jgi:hypothetical protein
MTTTEIPQHMAALAKANRVRGGGAEQRDALIGRPAGEVVTTLIHPPLELAALKLRSVIRRSRPGPIPRFSGAKLDAALDAVQTTYPHGRSWRDSLRLRDLSVEERRRLVSALLAHAPEWWREQAGEVWD